MTTREATARIRRHVAEAETSLGVDQLGTEAASVLELAEALSLVADQLDQHRAYLDALRDGKADQ